MDLSNIPSIFQSRLRLSIIAALISGPKDFTSLKKITAATDGNLGKQLEVLEKEAFIHSKKQFLSRRPNTTYALSDTGRKAFTGYVEMLQCLLTDAGQSRSQEEG